MQRRNVVATVDRAKPPIGVALGVRGAMASCQRLLCLAALAVLCPVVFGSAGSLTAGIELIVTTALIMGGAGHPLVGESSDFVGELVQGALDLYIAPTGLARAESTDPGAYHLVAVHTPSTSGRQSGQLPTGADILRGRPFR